MSRKRENNEENNNDIIDNYYREHTNKKYIDEPIYLYIYKTKLKILKGYLYSFYTIENKKKLVFKPKDDKYYDVYFVPSEEGVVHDNIIWFKKRNDAEALDRIAFNILKRIETKEKELSKLNAQVRHLGSLKINGKNLKSKTNLQEYIIYIED